MIAIIDYDAGNVKSVEHACHFIGGDSFLTRDPEKILTADHVILPGVGSFGDAMDKLERYGLTGVIREVIAKNTPFLGICLGEQLLFERSEESPGVPGLGILKGEVLRFPEKEGFKIPQIGWNSLHFPNPGKLFAGIPEESYVYFVHSYYVHAQDRACVTASCSYAAEADASVEKNNLFACQFHPEKSGDVGLQILRNFLSIRQ